MDKEVVCQPPPPPLPSLSSSERYRRVSWAGPREALERLKKAETREMEEVESDPISALVEQSNVVVNGEKFIVLRQIARGGFSSVRVLDELLEMFIFICQTVLSSLGKILVFSPCPCDF